MKTEKIKHPKKNMVYMLAYRSPNNQFIYGSGGYTKELFKPKTYQYLQSALDQYIKIVQTPNSKDMVTIDTIHQLKEEQREIYLGYLLKSRPACLAIEQQNFQQILDKWVVYPEIISEEMNISLLDSRKAAIEVRDGFIEQFRLYDIGMDMKSMLTYYETGLLKRL